MAGGAGPRARRMRSVCRLGGRDDRARHAAAERADATRSSRWPRCPAWPRSAARRRWRASAPTASTGRPMRRARLPTRPAPRARGRPALDPMQYLEANDAWSFFDRLGDLVRTGATNTNVGDVQVALIGAGRCVDVPSASSRRASAEQRQRGEGDVNVRLLKIIGWRGTGFRAGAGGAAGSGAPRDGSSCNRACTTRDLRVQVSDARARLLAARVDLYSLNFGAATQNLEAAKIPSAGGDPALRARRRDGARHRGAGRARAPWRRPGGSPRNSISRLRAPRRTRSPRSNAPPARPGSRTACSHANSCSLSSATACTTPPRPKSCCSCCASRARTAPRYGGTSSRSSRAAT